MIKNDERSKYFQVSSEFTNNPYQFTFVPKKDEPTQSMMPKIDWSLQDPSKLGMTTDTWRFKEAPSTKIFENRQTPWVDPYRYVKAYLRSSIGVLKNKEDINVTTPTTIYHYPNDYSKFGNKTPINTDNVRLLTAKAIKDTGLSDAQTLAIMGEINRENRFNVNTLFGLHDDPARTKTGKIIKNMGFLSWNGDRKKRLEAIARQRGLLKENGTLENSYDSLVLMAQFMRQEMELPMYKKHLKPFFDNPDLDPMEYGDALAKYIGWAKHQDTIWDSKAGGGR